MSKDNVQNIRTRAERVRGGAHPAGDERYEIAFLFGPCPYDEAERVFEKVAALVIDMPDFNGLCPVGSLARWKDDA